MAAQSNGITLADKQEIKFVQSFYDWYLRQPEGKTDPWALDTAIKQRPELFDAPLLKALQIYANARAHANGEIGGLDFDPFLNSQAPSTHFKAVSARGACVRVIGYEQQISRPREVISVEVHCTPQHCVFVNFHYPAQDGIAAFDLLSILRELHPPKESAP
jgi:hypothetical protein